jgi:hypothetical protein
MGSPGGMTIDPTMRETLKGLADVLLPAAERMPAASGAGVHDEWLDRVLAARPDLVPMLARVLTEAAGRQPDEEVRRLKREDRPGFLALASACAGGYYLNPDVRRRLGYPGQEPVLPEPGESEHELADGILQPVIARGSIYRPTPR